MSAIPPETSANSQHPQRIWIRPLTGWRLVSLLELWRYRELLYFLSWRDIKVRYKQTTLGAAWAVIQPLAYMLVFTFIFGRLAEVRSDGLPYPLFAFSGLLPWLLFSNAVGLAGNSVVDKRHIITKIYFPRLLIPVAAIGPAVLDFLVACVLLVGLMLYYAMQSPAGALLAWDWQCLVVIPVFLLVVLAALAVGIVLAALNVAYRDFKHTIPFLMQVWMFATPAIYMSLDPPAENPPPAASRVADETVAQSEVNRSPDMPSAVGPGERIWRWNPLTGLITSFRAALLNRPLPWSDLCYSGLVVVGAFVAACLYFGRAESSFADIV